MYSLLLTILCAAGGVFANSPCKLRDKSCVLKVANDLRPILFADADPASVNEVTGEIAGIKYKLYDTSFFGIASCKVTHLYYPVSNGTEFTIQEDWDCPKLSMTGKYDLAGQVSGAPAEGHGDFSFTTGEYLIHLDKHLNKYSSEKEKVHVSLTNFELIMIPQEPVKFEYTNFDGPMELADSFNAFNNEHWKESTETIQKPILYASLNAAYDSMNEVLNKISIRNYIAN